MRNIIYCDERLQIEDASNLKIAPQIVYLTGEISAESGAKFRRDLEQAEQSSIVSGQNILPICIDSEGGCIYALMGMIDALEACKKAGNVRIATVIESKAMSGAVALFSCGEPDLRYMGPKATIMIHDASGGAEGTLGQIDTEIKELRRLNCIYFEEMKKNFMLKKAFLEDNVRKKGVEYYINAQQAKKLGIIKHIKIPVFETHIRVTHKFK
jgi:ATP-dependent protease ClpP protease subunit